MQRLQQAITAIVLLGMLGLFCYGLYRYPDAPLHSCGAQQFCGKQGQPHTCEEYIAFKRWETTLIWVWPPGMFVLFLLNRKRVMRRMLSRP